MCIFRVSIDVSAQGRHGHDSMVVGLSTTCAIMPYHHQNREFEPRVWRDVLDTILSDQVCE
jgi:hypothetical protein